MAYRFVTCPETAHLETLEFEDTPFGMLVLGCSRFDPPCAPSCARTCAARLDQRSREDLDDDDDDDTCLNVLELARAAGYATQRSKKH